SISRVAAVFCEVRRITGGASDPSRRCAGDRVSHDAPGAVARTISVEICGRIPGILFLAGNGGIASGAELRSGLAGRLEAAVGAARGYARVRSFAFHAGSA